MEWPGILAWMIDGCLAWYRDGLNPPAAVIEATKAYLEVQDALAAWLAECCEVRLGPDGFEDTASRLFGSWKAYAERTGEPPQSQKAFAPKLEARGFQRYRRKDARGYRGLRLAETPAEPHWTDRG